jgi:hypothetical protein
MELEAVVAVEAIALAAVLGQEDDPTAAPSTAAEAVGGLVEPARVRPESP